MFIIDVDVLPAEAQNLHQNHRRYIKLRQNIALKLFRRILLFSENFPLDSNQTTIIVVRGKFDESV